MRLYAYGAISTLVASGVVLKAFTQRANFYSASVYLAQSNASLMILTNFGVFLTLLFGTIIQKIFYGQLRAAEVEHLYEKAWYAVTETCLAMTIFREEFGGAFIVMFTTLLFLKCFHWLGSDRVEFMEQTPPTNPRLFHLRLASSLFLLCATDILLTRYCVSTLLSLDRPNMTVMFAFEFAILTISCLGIVGRYLLGVYEKYVVAKRIRLERERRIRVFRLRESNGELEEGEELPEPDDDEIEADVGAGWEEKGVWSFYLEILFDLLKLVIYLLFFAIVLTFYGLPLHIIRDVYMTLRSFITRIRDFIRYRKATAHMNSRYPDATVEEVEHEGVCIICRENMVAWSEPNNTQNNANNPNAQVVDQRTRPKKLPCGHVLHFSCLRSWMERQQSCPTCRRPVLDEPPAHLQTNAAANAPAPAAPANGQAPQPAPPGAPNGRNLVPEWFGGPPEPAVPVNPPPPAPAAAAAPAPQAQPGFMGFFPIPPGGIIQGIANHLERRQRAQRQQTQGANASTNPAAQPLAAQNAISQYQFAQWVQARDYWLDVSQRQQAAVMQQVLGEVRTLTEEVRRIRDQSTSQTTTSEANTSQAGPSTATSIPSLSSSSLFNIPGLQLPEGYSLIPLTALAQIDDNNSTNNLPNLNPPPQNSLFSNIQSPSSPTPADIALRPNSIRRRGDQREYEALMRDYHASNSPNVERLNPINGTSPSAILQDRRQILARTASQSQTPATTTPPSTSSLFMPSPASTLRRPSANGMHSLNRRGSQSPLRHSRSGSSAGVPGDQIPLMDSDIETLLNFARNPVFEPASPTTSTEDPSLGRDAFTEARRASAGEITLTETDSVWPGMISNPSVTRSAGGSAGGSGRSSPVGSEGRRSSGRRSSLFNVVNPQTTVGEDTSSPLVESTSAVDEEGKGKWKGKERAVIDEEDGGRKRRVEIEDAKDTGV